MNQITLKKFFTVTALGIAAACFTGCETMNNTPKGTITKADFGALIVKNFFSVIWFII